MQATQPRKREAIRQTRMSCHSGRNRRRLCGHVWPSPPRARQRSVCGASTDSLVSKHRNHQKSQHYPARRRMHWSACARPARVQQALKTQPGFVFRAMRNPSFAVYTRVRQQSPQAVNARRPADVKTSQQAPALPNCNQQNVPS